VQSKAPSETTGLVAQTAVTGRLAAKPDDDRGRRVGSDRMRDWYAERVDPASADPVEAELDLVVSPRLPDGAGDIDDLHAGELACSAFRAPRPNPSVE
jgi:hypothetical protein